MSGVDDRPMYRCRECGHEWQERVAQPTECPECGHLWIDWLNYDDIKHLSRQYRGKPFEPR